jgi:very-short-patch-repair endonuclease
MLRVLACRGRSGITTMRQLLADRPAHERQPESNLERHFQRLARQAGIPELQVQVDIADETGWLARVDFFDPSLGLIVEIDSVVHHSTLTDRRHDDATTTLLRRAGYKVLRFTEVEVFFQADLVRASLRTAFSQRNVG